MRFTFTLSIDRGPAHRLDLWLPIPLVVLLFGIAVVSPIWLVRYLLA